MKIKRITSSLLVIVMLSAVFGIILETAVKAAEYAWSQEQYYRDSIAAYNDFDYSDPQHIPDKNFFGVWDEEADTWAEGYVPYFYYEEFPEMAAVEEAAKRGDYLACKEALLEYYREKSASYNITYPERSTLYDQARARAELGFSNMSGYSYTNTAGRTYFTEEEGWHSVNIMSDFQTLASVNDKRKIYSIVAANKDGYRVEIDDNEYKPYIVAYVNGEKRTFYPTRTTYTDGNVSSQAELQKGVLLVEESVTSINEIHPGDENTKRAFIQFDFENIFENDQLGSATLYLYGRMVEDDIPDAPRLERDYKMVHIYPWTAEQSIKNDLTADYLDDFTEYSFNFDGESGARISSLRKSDPTLLRWHTNPVYDELQNAYYATGDETFAFHAIRHMQHMSIYWGNLEEFTASASKVYMNPLGVASIGYDLVWHLDAFINSTYMTPEAFTLIIKHFWVRGKWLETYWGDAYETCNHGGYGAKGLLAVAMYFYEFRDAHGPINADKNGNFIYSNKYGGSVSGGWLEVANFRNSYKVGQNMNEDGSSWEAPIGYSFESLNAYLAPKQYGEKLNFDYTMFYTPKVEDESDYIYKGKQDLIKALKFLITRLSPQYGEFQVGDSGSWQEKQSGQFEPFLDLIDDPEIEYIATEGERGINPDLHTTVYDDGDVATFRNHFNDEYAIAASFVAPGGISHQHVDDLSISLIGYNNFLLVDPRNGNYDEEDRSERWASSTRGHNTIEINDTVGRGQREYAVQYDPIVFVTEIDENGNEVPKKDADGIEMKDDPLYVPIKQSGTTVKDGHLYPEDREINSVYDYIRGRSYTYYDNNAPTLNNEDFDLHRNILFLRSGYFVVTDIAEPTIGKDFIYQDDFQKENNIVGHKYKQLWHFLPNANMEINEEKNTAKTNFNGDANIIVATVKNNNNMTINPKYGLYAYRRAVFDVCKYVTYEQYTTGRATFNTLLYPLEEGEDAEITTRNIELELPQEDANAFVATITDLERNLDTDIYYYTLFDESKKAPMTFGSYKTDGSLALSENKEGKYVNAVLRHGSYLENIMNHEYVVYSEEEIEDIGVYWQNDEIDIAYNSEDEYNNVLNLDALTIKSNGTVSVVRLNGKDVDFKNQGGYIYFGDKPILEVEETNPDENGESQGSDNVIHGAGGTGGSSSGSSDSDSEDVNKENIPDSPNTETKPSDAYSKELSGHWAEKEISYLVDNNIVQGYGDGVLGVSQNITRAQFITMLVRALEMDIKDYVGSFGDVSEDSWYADYMETAYQNGWIVGDGANCHPERNITREEITKIVVSAFEQKFGEITTENDTEFTDKETFSQWAVPFIGKATASGLMNGMGNGEFKPKENAKREQAMVLIYRMINSL